MNNFEDYVNNFILNFQVGSAILAIIAVFIIYFAKKQQEERKKKKHGKKS